MSGTALSNFTDFVKATGPSYVSSAEQLVNEAVNQTYVLARLLKGRDNAKVLQGGKTIIDDVMFDESNTYGHYLPNATFTWQNPQVLSELSINWRFSIDHMSWTDQEITLNVPAGLTKDAAKVVYKRLKRVKEQRMWTSMVNGMEADLWRSAHNQQTAMESASGDTPYSIPAFISEDTTNYMPSGWTVIQNVSPTTESRWRNQVSRYKYDDPDDSGGTNTGLFDAFSRMYRKIDFHPPGTREEYFENPDLARFMICCSLLGVTLYEKMCRESQDRFAVSGQQDPAFLTPAYGGIELVYIKALDTAALYNKSASFYSEVDSNLSASGTWSATDMRQGPRYYWINGNYLTPIYHTERYMTMHDPMKHPNQPFTTVVPVDTWWNLFCNSRQRHGIVGPGADSTAIL